MEEIQRLNDALTGRYTIMGEIGRGGMATVYLAEDLRQPRQVAVKVLSAEVSGSVAVERFQQEIEIASGLSHPLIVPLHDSGIAGPFLFFVMPLVEGETVRERINRTGPLPMDEAVRYTGEVLDALQYAHSRGILHRDVKPDNILLSGRHALLADFGVARAIEVASDTRLTQTGTFLGTPLYMSPESLSPGRVLDGRSDLYSVGCVLFEMLAGRPPFPGEDLAAVQARHLRAKPPLLSTLVSSVPSSLDRVVERALAKDPDARFATAEEFRQVLEGEKIGPQPSADRLKKLFVALAALLALVFGAPAVFRSLRDTFGPGSGGPVVVLPLQANGGTGRADSLAFLLAEELIWQLNGFDSVVAVPRAALSGAMFDEGIPGPGIETVDQGRAVARALGAGSLVTLSASLRGDTALVSASRYRPGRSGMLGQPIQHRGDPNEPGALVAPAIAALLGLDLAPDSLEALMRYTRDPQALEHFRAGRRALESWQLASAESEFRAAIARDTTFAMALHNLALTLYWASARDPINAQGPEISRITSSAVRHVSALSAGDQAHVRAFHSFQLGDLNAAREAYHRILRSDSTDVYAWLMLGSVEYSDRHLFLLPDSTWAPRSNLNLAVAAFSRTVQLSPGFDLGYGHLFDIQRLVGQAVDRGMAPRFDYPTSDPVAPWEPPDPQDQLTFFPAILDSIVWVTSDSFRALDPGLLREGATSLENRTSRLLDRWIAFAPDAPRARDELVEWLAYRLSRAVPPVSPLWTDSLASEAVRHATVGLSSRADTLPLDFYRLADLHLAAGHIEEARDASDQGFSLGNRVASGAELPGMAMNVLLASGQLPEALAAADRLSLADRYVRNREEDRIVPYGGAEPILERLRVLGTLGVQGEAVEETIDEILSIWSSRDYSDLDRVVLRRSATAGAVLALASHPDAIQEWIAGFRDADPLLLALQSTDSTEASHQLSLALQKEDPLIQDPLRSFLVGEVALRTGGDTLAARALSRLDSIPPRLFTSDPSWGYRTRSYLLRGRAYESMGDSERARLAYEAFMERWLGSGSPTDSALLQGARAGMERVGGGE